jgi:16S rRNA (cytosine967-C5)-methyltransferase
VDVPLVKATPARTTALKVVTAVRVRDAWVRPVLDAELADVGLDPRDANLARTLSIGVVETSGSRDVAIDRYARSPGSIEPRVRDALRIAAYEILFLSTAAHVAVDQGVELVRSVTPRAAGLANAILRKVADSAEGFPWVSTDTVEGRALLTGHPLWLAERLVEDLGRDSAFQILDANSRPAPVYVGVDLLRGTADSALESLTHLGAEPRLVDPPGCIELGSPAAALATAVLADGLVFVSDAAAQQVAHLAFGAHGGRLVEIGAGHGTKTIAMLSHAERTRAALEIDAVDISRPKLEALADRIAPDARPRVTTHGLDVLDTAQDHAVPRQADAVLLDAPCSNVGTLRRHPERRWSLTPDDVTARATAAAAMLEAAAGLVRQGGCLLYSTCSVLPEENGEVVDAFLEASAGSLFSVESLADEVSPGFAPMVDGEGVLQTLPSVGGPDGHYAVRLRHGG